MQNMKILWLTGGMISPYLLQIPAAAQRRRHCWIDLLRRLNITSNFKLRLIETSLQLLS